MAVLDKNGTEYLWNKAKEKFAAKDDVPKTPEEVVLYTEQSLTDSQKAQARGNIGAVGTVEATEEAYTYVFTGEEESVPYGDSGVKYVYMEGVTIEFVNGVSQFAYSSNGEIITMDTSKGTEDDLGEVLAIMDAENWLFLAYAKKDGATANGVTLPKQGVYSAVFPADDVPIVSITSTAPYTKTTQKIDEALIPDHAHSWEELKDKPFYEKEETVNLLSSQEVTFADWGGIGGAQLSLETDAGTIGALTVVFDGISYDNLIAKEEGYFGNLSIAGAGEDTGEPFLILISGSIAQVITSTSGTHAVAISAISNLVKEIDNKYYKKSAYELFGTLFVNEDGTAIVNGTGKMLTADEFIEFAEKNDVQCRMTMTRSLACEGAYTSGSNGNIGIVVNSLNTTSGAKNTVNWIKLAIKNYKFYGENNENNAVIEPLILIPALCLQSPSGKLFKLTVDDSGTITTTEVV